MCIPLGGWSFKRPSPPSSLLAFLGAVWLEDKEEHLDELAQDEEEHLDELAQPGLDPSCCGLAFGQSGALPVAQALKRDTAL